MSSDAYAAPLRLELRPSSQRRWWRRLTHFAVLVSLPLLQSPWLALAVAVALLVSWRRTRAERETILLWHSDGRWTLFEDGAEFDATVAGLPFIQPWLVILPLRTGRQRRARRVVVFADILPAHDFRRLRVRLRAGGDAP